MENDLLNIKKKVETNYEIFREKGHSESDSFILSIDKYILSKDAIPTIAKLITKFFF